MARKSTIQKATARVAQAVAVFEHAAAEVDSAVDLLDAHATDLNEAITALCEERDSALTEASKASRLAERLRGFVQ